MMSHNKILRLCTDAVLAALFFALSLFSIKVGDVFKFTLSSFPILLAGLLFGLPDACAVAVIGAFLEQALSSYGLPPTTPLWLLPAIVRALTIGIYAAACRKTYRYYSVILVCVLSSFLVTVTNTAVMYLDSVILGYYSYAYVFGAIIPRFISGLLTGVLYGVLCPLALRKI
ncbi:MAG: ECF transporter S component, partial [Clostridia bacterium]|nr:ECF transporter S component [Clostridia bacterium]